MGCPKLYEDWRFVSAETAGRKRPYLFHPEKNRSRSAPAEMDGGWNLYAMVGNDPVGRWDLRGTESGKKGCKSCKCCCVEKIAAFIISWLEKNEWRDEIEIDVTQKIIDMKNIIVEKPECSFKWEEKSDMPINLIPGDGQWHDVSWFARNSNKFKVVVNWGPMKNGYIEEAFHDYSLTWIDKVKELGKKIHRHSILLTVYSSQDQKCKGVCLNGSLSLLINRKVDAVNPYNSTVSGSIQALP